MARSGAPFYDYKPPDLAFTQARIYFHLLYTSSFVFCLRACPDVGEKLMWPFGLLPLTQWGFLFERYPYLVLCLGSSWFQGKVYGHAFGSGEVCLSLPLSGTSHPQGARTPGPPSSRKKINKPKNSKNLILPYSSNQSPFNHSKIPKPKKSIYRRNSSGCRFEKLCAGVARRGKKRGPTLASGVLIPRHRILQSFPQLHC